MPGLRQLLSPRMAMLLYFRLTLVSSLQGQISKQHSQKISEKSCAATVDWLSKNCDENLRMCQISYSKFLPKCAHARILVAIFWTTNWKSTVEFFPVNNLATKINVCATDHREGQYIIKSHAHHWQPNFCT